MRLNYLEKNRVTVMRESLQMQPSYNQNKANKTGLDKTIEGQKVILKK